MTANARMVVLGCRGSIPVSGPDFVWYGGNTTSFALAIDSRLVAFVDAGTGLTSYRFHGLELDPEIDVFLTHYHLDHIQGLSMLDAVWNGSSSITVHGPDDPEQALTSIITPPWFPASLSDAPAMAYATIDGSIDVAGVVVTPFGVEHPQGAVGYRVDGPSSSVAIVTDHETGSDRDDTVLRAVDGVDVLVHDAQYLPEEASVLRGWGHSTWQDAVEAANAAGAGELILTSHDPGRTDRELETIVHTARRRFPATEAARMGLEILL